MSNQNLPERVQDSARLALIKADEATVAMSDGYGDDVSLRLLVKAIPFLGPVLDTVLSEPGQRARRQRLTWFLEELRDGLANVDASKVDADFLRSAEFEGIVESILRRAAVTSRRAKLENLRRALLGSITFEFSKTPVLETFVQAVDILSGEHIAFLADIEAHGGSFSSQDREIHDEDPEGRLQFESSLRADDSVQMELLFDLTARGFIAYEPTEGAVIGVGKSNLYLITALGRRFLSFLRSHENLASESR